MAAYALVHAKLFQVLDPAMVIHPLSPTLTNILIRLYIPQAALRVGQVDMVVGGRAVKQVRYLVSVSNNKLLVIILEDSACLLSSYPGGLG